MFASGRTHLARRSPLALAAGTLYACASSIQATAILTGAAGNKHLTRTNPS